MLSPSTKPKRLKEKSEMMPFERRGGGGAKKLK